MQTLGVKGISRVDGAQQTPNPLQCSLPLTSTDSAGKPALAKGMGPVTFNRASKQLVVDHEGQLRPVYDGCAGVEGSRIVTNLLTYSQDFTNAAWIKSGTCTFANGVLLLPSSLDNIGQTQVIAIQPGTVVTGKFVLSGTGTVTLRVQRASGSEAYEGRDQVVTLTGEELTYSVKHTFTAPHDSVKLCIIKVGGNTASAVAMKTAQLEIVTSQSNQAPGEYVPTTNAPVTQCFAYANPFTVDGNGVVTDSGVRTLLPAIKGILLEPATTNKCTNYSVIPGDTLGPELITNAADRDFSSDTGFWLKNFGSISGGVFTASGGGNGSIERTTLLTIGKVYQATFTVGGYSPGSVGVSSATTTGGSYVGANGTYTRTFVAIAPTFKLVSTQAGVTFDDISVKEVQFAVGTKATALNPTAIPGLTLSGYTQTSGALVVGAQYKINARTTLDFTTCGAASNAVGTTFTATGGTLGAGDSVDNLSVSLSIVDDTAAHQAAGIYAVTGGKAYRFDDALGVTILTVALTLSSNNSNPVSFMLLGRVIGAIAGRIKARGGGASASFSNTAYAWIKKENETIVEMSLPEIKADAGAVILFILNQLEEQPFCTSPVIVQNAAATRAATVESLPSAGNIKGNDFTVYLEFQTPVAINIANQLWRLFSWYTNSSNLGSIQFDGGAVRANSVVANVNSSADWSHAVVPNTLYKVAATFTATGIKLFVNGALRATYTGALATNVLSASSIRLGSQGDDTGFLKGNIKGFQIFRKVFSDAKCISMTQ